MRNLLKANFSRLGRSKIFYLAIIAMAGLAAFTIWNQWDEMRRFHYIVTLDYALFTVQVVFGIVAAILVSLFVGVEYSDGTIRNKLLVGRKRADIYLANFITCGAALGFMLLEVTEAYTVKLEKAIFQCLSIYGVVTAVFVSLFLGAEYGNGTIRNKITIGIRRETIYLSGFVTAAAGCVLMYSAAMLTAGIAGVCLFEAGVPAGKIFTGLGLGLLTGLSYAGIYCLISMLCHNKAITAVCCLVLSLMLLFLSVFVNFRLAQPEMVETLGGIKVTGEMELTVDDENGPELETVPNPHYVSGVRRKIYTGLQNINPAGQAAGITAVSYGRPGSMAASSILIGALCCAGGVWLFRRKDIR